MQTLTFVGITHCVHGFPLEEYLCECISLVLNRIVFITCREARERSYVVKWV